ncbi:Tetratricopeptide (TPR) repeat [Singulisphaera sp. GP187]|uniref:KGGVGR-motif variant AAA ATPase n=1 Tax=Singulisphaera sp. GP187 TaxID=1882752 RepID=UPI0009282CD4|nr:tetratricopeptide repeat protein [Singulisphaera sp. GP187]SIO33113.1 Tetratricopeptide (TPR) repeat [Singulisphaera sp. GP187]
MNAFPQIFAFYSFKGGVGRSMAVLNLAYALAAVGRNVLILDMDLEAPGLSGFLDRNREIPGFAALDMVDLVKWASTTSLPLDPLSFPLLSEYVVSVPREKLQGNSSTNSEPGRLDILPVEEERDYYERLTALAMGSYDQEALVQIGSILRAWIKSLRFPIEVPDYYGPTAERAAAYDYVLVDSRTGITETGGLCIGPLSDQLVVLTALNDQNVKGTCKFLKEVGILESLPPSSTVADPPRERTGPRPGSKPCLIIASLVPAGEIETKRKRLKHLEESLGKVVVKLSYHPQLALQESIFTRDYRDEYLAHEYDTLLRQILNMAGDGNDDALPERLTRRKHSPAEFRETLHRLLRSATVSGSENLLLFLLSEAIRLEIKNEDDFILWDRVCRALSGEAQASSLSVITQWANLLSQWSLYSIDSGLAALRIEAAMNRYKQVCESDKATSRRKAEALFNRGVTYGLRGEREKELADYSAVIQITDAPLDLMANAFFNRGVTHGEQGEPQMAIDDYSSIIQMTDAPAEQKAKALFSRGMMFGQLGQPQKEIDDYSAVIQMDDAPAEHKAKALINRGVTFGQLGQPQKEIDDYSAVIQMTDASAEQKAEALFNRGVTHGEQGEPQMAIDDYSSIIQMTDAPAEQKAKALSSRGMMFGQLGQPQKEIDDYSAVIQMDDAPAEHKAKALINRGVTSRQLDEPQKAIDDYSAVIQMDDAPAEHKAKALINRGVTFGQVGESQRAIDDYSAVIQMDDAPAEHKAKAFFNRGVAYEQQRQLQKAINDYSTVIQITDVLPELKVTTLVNRSWAHYSAGRHREAIEDGRQAVSLNPSDWTAHNNLAISLLVFGQTAEALQSYEAAIALADSAQLDEITADLRAAIDKNGPLTGAEDIIDRIEARRQVLMRE